MSPKGTQGDKDNTHALIGISINGCFKCHTFVWFCPRLLRLLEIVKYLTDVYVLYCLL